MTADQLREQLNGKRIHKPKVMELVAGIRTNAKLIVPLLATVHEQDKQGMLNACWVFDHVLRQHPEIILLVLDPFLEGLPKMQSESCMRTMAHACEHLTEYYFKKKHPLFTAQVTSSQLEKIATVCFDWLISDHKVATKVFAMTSLFYLGEKFLWIRPELKLYLEQNIGSGSAGFQNRGAKLLVKLKNLGY
ncbi:MAG: adenylosuccinate lyase [Bacteroidota bacterium]